jgi:predicted S18 family serine protease
MKLLAVSETETGFQGSTADLFLDIRPGTGKIYVDTFPLTKVDTQMSIRFANSVACDYLDLDCSTKDFFYTIRSDSATVGGPSAGAATAVLTVAALQGDNYDETITITGTMNSGGLIGPIGGLASKIQAAADEKLTKVLIPKGERITECDECEGGIVDVSLYGEERGVEIIEVATLDEAIQEFTGEKRIENLTLEVVPFYGETMEKIARDLCERTVDLGKRAGGNFTELVLANNLSAKGIHAISVKEYYSAASYCFGANIRYSYLIMKNRYPAREEILRQIQITERNLTWAKETLRSVERQTITDLQAYTIVVERLTETEDRLNNARKAVEQKPDDAIMELSYANERLISAGSWSAFFGLNGVAYELNPVTLKDSCINKLSEAEERYQYAQLFLPGQLNDTRKDILKAYEYSKEGQYELCLYKASIAKAESNVIISAFSIGGDSFDSYLSHKLELVRKNLARQEQKGIFPILGYSYYEYAMSLKESDLSSALLYSEYALELANVDMYFPRDKELGQRIVGIMNAYSDLFALFVMFSLGLAFGVLVKGAFEIRKRK